MHLVPFEMVSYIVHGSCRYVNVDPVYLTGVHRSLGYSSRGASTSTIGHVVAWLRVASSIHRSLGYSNIGASTGTIGHVVAWLGVASSLHKITSTVFSGVTQGRLWLKKILNIYYFL